jgi:hypothetical protein
MIRIDIDPSRDNLIHTIRTLLTPVHVCFLWTVLIRGNLSHWPNSVGWILLLLRKGPMTQSTARQLTDPRVSPYFLSHDNHWSSRLKSIISWWTNYINLLGSYLEHVISIFNIFSWVPINRSLTDIDGDYNLRNVNFPHHCDVSALDEDD